MVRAEEKAFQLAYELIQLSKNEWWRLLRSYILRDYIGAIRSFQLVIEYLGKVISSATGRKNNIKQIGHDLSNIPRELDGMTRKTYEKRPNGAELYSQDTKRIIQLTQQSHGYDSESSSLIFDENADLMDIYNNEIGTKDKHTENYYLLFSATPNEKKINDTLSELKKYTANLKIISKKKIYSATDEEIIDFLKYTDGKFLHQYQKYGADSLIVRQLIKKFRDENLYNKELLAGFYYNYHALFCGQSVAEMVMVENTLSQPHQQLSRYPDPDNPHSTNPLNVYTRSNILVKKLPWLIYYTKISLIHTQRYYSSLKKVYEMELKNKKKMSKRNRL